MFPKFPMARSRPRASVFGHIHSFLHIHGKEKEGLIKRLVILFPHFKGFAPLPISNDLVSAGFPIYYFVMVLLKSIPVSVLRNSGPKTFFFT